MGRWLFFFYMEDQLKKLQVLLSSMDQDFLSKSDFIKEFERVLSFVKALKEGNTTAFAKINGQIGGIVSRLKENNEVEITQAKNEVLALVSDYIKQIDKTTAQKMKAVDSRLAELKSGMDGKDADEQAITKTVAEAIQAPLLDKIEKDLPTLGTAIRDGLEVLNGKERLDKSAIKGLDDYDEVARLAKQPKAGGFGGGLSRGVADGLYITGVGTHKMTVGAVEPTNPAEGDIWIQI
jgi:hypothetical protein